MGLNRGMQRRDLLQVLVGGGAFALLGFLGLRTAEHFLPRPPRKILIKEKDLPLPGRVKVGEEYFLVRAADGRLRAFSRRCPHLGCTVNYIPDRELFLCPCHQSRFTLTGAYIAGPAKRGLYALRFERTRAGLVLEIPG
ncbi:ubiquinol-cytochrome c reductase iron-sulfur subunit [Thermosulfurimonas sp. F29]|uniref:QcrA and Rieske domain-containing protein n=1 Tax=Thermosulfurimonas sp. F29 TaxID=2867247 RepID=UPI001C83579C|nr:Rieske (2Fe-2S) protein [Thermosulfurimonas sp. F29]MBX6422417.1 Rieske (2Fe-2S) protein [Thermosulfurimonas sp. F29]